MAERIGFIGLGIMGRGMAHNLLKAGFELTVWNRTAARMDEFVQAGATAAQSPAAVAERSDIVITCVSDTPDVEAVVLADNGVIHGASPGSLVVDMSTISPDNNAWFSIGSRSVACGLKKGGNDTEMFSGDLPDSESRRARVTVVGTQYSLDLDGKNVCSFEDNALSAGRIGLYASINGDTSPWNTSPWVDNFKVTQIR
jgi:hypothetical protein